MEYKSLKITQKSPNSRVYYLYLNRPGQLNALSRGFFTEFPKAISSLDHNPDVAVIILASSGKHFCSGIDLQTLSDGFKETHAADHGRNVVKLRRHIKFLQEAVTALESCRKPVIAAVHCACIGGGIDIITACDIRYCCSDTFFSVKEVDLAITADLGTLQRLPSIVGFGNAMELALTGRRFTASEAKDLGLVSKVFTSREALMEGVNVVAEGFSRLWWESHCPSYRLHAEMVLNLTWQLSIHNPLSMASSFIGLSGSSMLKRTLMDLVRSNKAQWHY